MPQPLEPSDQAGTPRALLHQPISRWWIVAAGAITNILNNGYLVTYAFVIFSREMVPEFGWSREEVSDMIGIYFIGSGAGSLLLGWLIARQGIRPPSIGFVVMAGLIYAALAILPPSPGLFMLAFVLFGFFGVAGTSIPYTVAISGFFDAQRGLAIGLVVAGTGLSAILVPQFAEQLLVAFGWRGGVAVLGLAAAALPAIGLLFFVRTPEGVVTGAAFRPARALAWVADNCLLSRTFWFILIPLLAVSIAVIGAVSSYVFLFADRGVPAATVPVILSVAGGISWLGRPVVGYLMDRIFAPYVAAVVFILGAAGALLLALDSALPVQFVGATLIALALGTEVDIMSFLVSRYAALRDYSRVVSAIWVVTTWGAAAGTVLAARSHTLTGSYEAVLLIFAAMMLGAAVMVSFIGPYLHPVHHWRSPEENRPAEAARGAAPDALPAASRSDR